MTFLVQPRLVNGPFEDPGLYLDFRYARRAILFDLGELGALSPRELLRVSHAFVSHAHMDHVAGFDRLLRLCLHRPEPLSLVGPCGFADQVEHRLRSFTWNLLDAQSVDFRLRVAEFDGVRLFRSAELRARDGFARRDAAVPDPGEGLVLADENLTVAAAALDHGTPSLAFALREGVRVNVWRNELDALGLPVGPWLNEAKDAVRRGLPDAHCIAVPGAGAVPLGRLRERAFKIAPGQVVAYVTDADDHSENRAKIVELARDADQLFIEATFLDRDRATARATRHLTARAAGEIARAAGARHVTAFHHSARYLDDPNAPRRELREAFKADAPLREAEGHA